MRAILCGANGAMGKLIDGILGESVVGRVSIDGENGVCKTFEELGSVGGDDYKKSCLFLLSSRKN